MEYSQTCARCGGSNLEAGRMETGRGRVFFKLLNAPFFSLLSTNVNIEATICLDCGNIQLTGDVGRAREILKK